MKARWVIGILLVAVLFFQRISFAEFADNITATAEDIGFTEDSASEATDSAPTTGGLAASSVDPKEGDTESVQM